MIRASAARGMGLVDELVPSPLNLRWAARKAVERKRKSKPAPHLEGAVCGNGRRAGLLAKKLRAETAKKVREDHYPAPFRLIDLFETHAGNLDGMKVAETRAFAPLMVSDTSRNLRRVFKLSEMLKAQAPKDLDFKPLRVHVIGAGVMGADIAGWCVASGMEVSLQDLNAEQIAKGIDGAEEAVRPQVQDQGRSATRPAARLIADPKGATSRRADVVIEAIVEKLEVKQNLFKSIEGKLKPGAVLATNTSSIMIENIAEPLADPGRLIGIHFFNPVAQMPLVEVIKGATQPRGGGAEGLRVRDRDRQVPADRQERPGLPRQPRAGALHDGRPAAGGTRRGQGEDRRGGARFRHADGADRAGRYGRASMCAPTSATSSSWRRRADRSSTRWWRPASSARSRARASTSGRTANRRRREPEKPCDKARAGAAGPRAGRAADPRMRTRAATSASSRAPISSMPA